MANWTTEVVRSATEIRARGYTHGYGLPSDDNPYPVNGYDFGLWRDAHFEGQCDAIDEGIRPAP